jgi:hypothetical protein
MSERLHHERASARHTAWMAAGVLLTTFVAADAAQAVNFPITGEQRNTARQVAQAGVPLSELAPNAPDSHTVRPGDTLWDISRLFLRSPWRWPELWGMNLDQIRNPHLIYPGQMLLLDKSDGTARLRLAQPIDGGTIKLSPRVRAEALDSSPIASIPMHLIAPFLNEAVVFDTNALETAPRVVAAQEGRVMMSRGDTAYVRGDLTDMRDWRVFREPQPLRDPTTGEVLGFEARYVGTVEYVRKGETRELDNGKAEIVPATFTVTSIREEVAIGDRLAPTAVQDYSSYAPHPPTDPVAGQIVSIYGDALTAGQNQIVAINKGATQGVERGHVLALWRDGQRVPDRTDAKRPIIKLPDERHGLLFVFRVFERMSYALILTVQEPVKPGDRFTQP